MNVTRNLPFVNWKRYPLQKRIYSIPWDRLHTLTKQTGKHYGKKTIRAKLYWANSYTGAARK
jgi:hypothetical protein